MTTSRDVPYMPLRLISSVFPAATEVSCCLHLLGDIILSSTVRVLLVREVCQIWPDTSSIPADRLRHSCPNSRKVESHTRSPGTSNFNNYRTYGTTARLVGSCFVTSAASLTTYSLNPSVTTLNIL